MNNTDWDKIQYCFLAVKKGKKLLGKAKKTVQLSSGGTATIYSMGENNPVIRIAIKEE